jgi:lipopolysaccharide transport system ATP-binding protein
MSSNVSSSYSGDSQPESSPGGGEASSLIRIENLSKCYQLYDKPWDRLRQSLSRGRRKYYREFWALRDISLEVKQGECLGIIGRNGAGKSTLLQVVCGTLAPSSGDIRVKGRVAALLELGAGFNSEFTGRENVFLNAALMGLSRDEIEERFDEIVDFSGIGDFINQPVKTYSSGMYVRLAFSVATSVSPDILVIDEALSVGDGEFSRKSFDRIMAMKEAGKTILFCSHALYQVEALCNKAIWLEGGKMARVGAPAEVVMAYNDSLDTPGPNRSRPSFSEPEAEPSEPLISSTAKGTARIVSAKVRLDGRVGLDLNACSSKNELGLRVAFASDPALPTPHVGICFIGSNGSVVSSASTHFDNLTPRRNADGSGEVQVAFPKFPLLRGEYRVDVYLLCERGVHVYDSAIRAAEVTVTQDTAALGVVTLPHVWEL